MMLLHWVLSACHECVPPPPPPRCCYYYYFRSFSTPGKKGLTPPPTRRRRDRRGYKYFLVFPNRSQNNNTLKPRTRVLWHRIRGERVGRKFENVFFFFYFTPARTRLTDRCSRVVSVRRVRIRHENDLWGAVVLCRQRPRALRFFGLGSVRKWRCGIVSSPESRQKASQTRTLQPLIVHESILTPRRIFHWNSGVDSLFTGPKTISPSITNFFILLWPTTIYFPPVRRNFFSYTTFFNLFKFFNHPVNLCFRIIVSIYYYGLRVK